MIVERACIGELLPPAYLQLLTLKPHRAANTGDFTSTLHDIENACSLTTPSVEACLTVPHVVSFCL